MKLNLGIVAGILLLVPLSAGVAGLAPRPNSGGSELEGIREWGRGQAPPLRVFCDPPELGRGAAPLCADSKSTPTIIPRLSLSVLMPIVYLQ